MPPLLFPGADYSQNCWMFQISREIVSDSSVVSFDSRHCHERQTKRTNFWEIFAPSKGFRHMNSRDGMKRTITDALTGEHGADQPSEE